MLNNFKNSIINEILDLFDFGIFWKNVDGKYLGCNRYMLNLYNLKTHEEIIEKTDHHFLSKEQADKISIIDNIVLNGKNYCEEEFFIDVNSITKNYLIIKKAVYNSNNKIIGLLGVLIDITFIKQRLEIEKQQIILDEETKIRQIIDVVDVNIYWQDRYGHMLGCNQYVLDVFEMKSREDIIGKTEYDLLPKEEADRINAINKFVLEHGSFKGKEVASTPSGEQRIYYSAKNRMVDSQGNVIGIVGTSLDITAEKETERLLLENEKHKVEKHKVIEKQQEQFKKIAAQVAHDIGSPLASLKMIIPHCTALPENTRNALNKAATRISDIAENFLSQFKPKNENSLAETPRMPELIMAEISEILTEKKYQYNKLPIDFITNITQAGAFAFINIDVTSFKRMLSNVINNAVDALESKIGAITIGLDAIDNQVLITITDSGKGMPNEIKEKILNNIAITAGKDKGYGIGFTQIRDTLQNNEGKFDIESQVDIGTTVKLSFPKIKTPDWMAECIELKNNDIVIILDDDDSIHSAWELRFEKSASQIQRHHFKQGDKAVEFINNMPTENKDKIFLLTDYELLKQGLHGLDVVEKTEIRRSILVTSHHNNLLIRDRAILTNTKILPKPLAPQIPINIIKQKAEKIKDNTKNMLIMH